MAATCALGDGVRKFRSTAKTAGLATALRWAWFGAARRNSFLIYAASASAPGVANAGAVILSPVSADELALLAKTADFACPEAGVAGFAPGAECFVGSLVGEACHLLWIFGPEDPSRFFDLREGEAEINFCHTPARLRGRGIYREALKAALGMLFARGVRTVYIAVHDENLPSIRAIERAGFAKLGALTHFGAFHRPRWRTVESSASLPGTGGAS